MTLADARALVGEYFYVDPYHPEQADELLCAALRVKHIQSVSWNYRGEPERHLRNCLASTRALFHRAFKE